MVLLKMQKTLRYHWDQYMALTSKCLGDDLTAQTWAQTYLIDERMLGAIPCDGRLGLDLPLLGFLAAGGLQGQES